VLKPAARAAGLVATVTVDVREKAVPWVSFHTLRHTCSPLLFDAGKNVQQRTHNP
jgi:hypothetical protein